MSLMRLVLLSLLLGASVQESCAQPIIVNLVNGRNGKGLAKVRVYIVLGEPKSQHVLNLITDRDGTVSFEATDNKTFEVRPVGEIACGEQPIGTPARDYLINAVLSKGMVTNNDCGTRTVVPKPGRFTYFVRPATWWDLFKN